ncbi:hypothetical protein EDC05_003112 [Coemansia umbellata]|uniref:Snf7-domain-containing protein n=1 Tax=Coemansia umbellata TaxID=1424467 RepID=A0ABQ8PPR0_9FUNG|nr:hypothetical protein EDC05_003112 [Coemansia umbellata]
MRTLVDIDPPESTHGEKLLEAPSKPGNEPKKKQTEAKARGSYRRYTPQQIERLFDLVIEEGPSAKEAALMAGINVRTAQNYVKTYRDDEQKRLPGIERKPRKGCLGKLNETHTRFLTQLVNQKPTAVLHSTRCHYLAGRNFTAKSLARQAKQCEKDEQREKVKLKKAIKKGDTEIARIHASNAIRKKNEYVNLTKLASRIDAVSSRVQTAVTMHKVTGSMTNVVRGMDRAMESMNLERISQVMDKFESQFEDLDVQTEYLEGTIGGATTLSTPQEDVDTLMQQVADEAGLEVNQELGVMEAPQELPKEEELTERLARLRNAS